MFLGTLGWAAILLAATPATARCELRRHTSIPVEVDGTRAFVSGTLDGKPIRALVATGVERSFLMRPSAERLGLDPGRIPRAKAVGVGGPSRIEQVRVGRLELGGVFYADNPTIPVMGEAARPYDFLLGRDLLAGYEVEFDLANGVVTLFRAEGCGNEPLAYWDADWDETRLEKVDLPDHVQRGGLPPYRVTVRVNGVPLKANLDSGSSTSVLTLRGAAKVGVTPDMPGVELLGDATGVGKHTVQEWRATFESFRIGDEIIRNPKLCLANLYKHTPPGSAAAAIEPDMVLGADFFESHRILISVSQRRVYFSHNGGRVFRLIYDDGTAEGP